MKGFLEIKQEYNELRSLQRNEIIKYLEENNFKVKKRGKSGRGDKYYTSGGRFGTSYDLSNWKWIDASSNGKNFIISLQCFDVDPNSYNHHVLMDRIGVYMYEKYNSYEAYTKMEVTEIDLPMDDIKKRQLMKILECMFNR